MGGGTETGTQQSGLTFKLMRFSSHPFIQCSIDCKTPNKSATNVTKHWDLLSLLSSFTSTWNFMFIKTFELRVWTHCGCMEKRSKLKYSR